MEKISFKGVNWPRNPETYHHSYVREPVYEKNSAGKTVFTGMGPEKLKITGTGVFSGSGAYGNFQVLLNLFQQSGAGALYHPVWGTVQAYFTELEMTQEPKENYVAYRFAFLGADDTGGIPQ